MVAVYRFVICCLFSGSLFSSAINQNDLTTQKSQFQNGTSVSISLHQGDESLSSRLERVSSGRPICLHSNKSSLSLSLAAFMYLSLRHPQMTEDNKPVRKLE